MNQMNMIDAMGACGPATGCAAPSYPSVGQAAVAPVGPFGFGVSPWANWEIVGQYAGGPQSWEIIGQQPPAPATPTLGERVRSFLGQTTLGVTNQNWLLGAAALGGIALAYRAGWFGGKQRGRRG